MDQVLAAEDRLSDVQWLVNGRGGTRTRWYEIHCCTSPEETMASLASAICRHGLLGEFTSSTGIGNESLAGEVGQRTFKASFYDPEDVTVLPWTRVSLRGQVVEAPDGGSLIPLAVRPNPLGLLITLTSVLIGTGALLFGIFQFAAQQWWRSFGIALGITAALWVIPSGLLWWATREGRVNERELLSKLGDSISGTQGSER